MDVCAVPFLFPTAYYFKLVRYGAGGGYFKLSQRILRKIGVYPIRDHYYDPQFKFDQLKYPLDKDRSLPTIDLNDQVQLQLLKAFSYEKELSALPLKKTKEAAFFYDNYNFKAGDAEYLYSIIRHFHPKRLVEIGSGYSTLMAREAITQNKREDSTYVCDHICIEPYEMPWLESAGVKVLRKKVEDIEPSFFDVLQENDILFIDSSHMIRPQGDVLFEYLEIFPRLKKGVLIHIHDIFTPRNYPESWLVEEVRLWNEQYLLEAFLSYNDKFEILGALNYLSHHYRKQFAEKCPIFKIQEKSEPASLWLRRKTD